LYQHLTITTIILRLTVTDENGASAIDVDDVIYDTKSTVCKVL